MQSIVNELARRLNLPPSQVESAIGDLLIRVRAALETIGEAEVGGLGTFRSIDGQITFQPAASFAEAVNREFAAMKPVALTSTGESVDVDDQRAIPGSDASFEEPVTTKTVEEELTDTLTDTPVPDFAAEIARLEAEELEASLEGKLDRGAADETELAEDEVEEEESVRESSFSSPPPPVPSKVRIPPSERRELRERRRRSSSRSEGGTSDEFPDMGSVVSTRPVEPIRAAAPEKKPKSSMPAVIAAIVVVVALLSWLVIGGDDNDAGEVPQSMASVSSQSQEVAQEAEPAPERERGSSAPSGRQSLAESVTAAMREESAKEAVVEESSPETVEEVRETPAVEVIELPVQQPAASEAVPQPTPQETQSIYAWIVGSYPSRLEADARVETLRAAGFEAHVYEATVRGRAAFRVGVGQFDSEAGAINGRSAVPPEVTDAWVTRVN